MHRKCNELVVHGTSYIIVQNIRVCVLYDLKYNRLYHSKVTEFIVVWNEIHALELKYNDKNFIFNSDRCTFSLESKCTFF